MLTDLTFAAFTAALAYWAGDLSIELAVFIGWVTFRVETMCTTFNLLTNAVQTMVVVDNHRLQREVAIYEGAVEQIASNN